MKRVPTVPPMEGLRRHIRKNRMNKGAGLGDAFIRKTYRLPRTDAREKAQEWFSSWPKAAYWTEVESWRQLPDDQIEFTMRRLPTAD